MNYVTSVEEQNEQLQAKLAEQSLWVPEWSEVILKGEKVYLYKTKFYTLARIVSTVRSKIRGWSPTVFSGINTDCQPEWNFETVDEAKAWVQIHLIGKPI